MNSINELIGKHIDFHFALALIAVFGTAGFLFLQLNEADNEFDILNASVYSVARNQGGIDSRENDFLNHELDEIAKSLDDIKF